jgi:hypothetical protein
MDGGSSRVRSFPASSLELPGFAPSAWISAAEFAALRAHPGLPGAVAAFAAFLIDVYDGNVLLNKLLCDRGRVLVGLFVLYLEVLPLPGTDKRGATLSAVQALCRRTRLCSPGRAASVLAAMRFGGYVTLRTDPNDHRRRFVTPGHKLLAVHHRNWARQFEAMAHVFPDSGLVPTRLGEPAYRTALLRQLGSYYLDGFRVLDHAPVLADLAESNGGLLIMSCLALRQLTGEGLPGEAVPISVSALSRQFCVSRGHVRNMLAISARAGLLGDSSGSEHIVVRPPLVEALLQFYGVMFMLFHRCAVGALREAEPMVTKSDPPNSCQWQARASCGRNDGG